MRAVTLRRLLGLVASVARRPADRDTPPPAGRSAPERDTARRDTARPGAYAGDHTGPVTAVYAPDLDGAPDPGEVVWAWVPFEEDHRRGKDRPVLVVGRDGAWLLGLVLSTRDHDEHPRRGEDWLDLGSGGWDRQGRPSEVRLDRVVRLDPSAVRREGAVLDRERFDAVARSLATQRG